jgi:hypothetical protein
MEPDLGEMLKQALTQEDSENAFRQAVLSWRFMAQGRSPHAWFWHAHALITAADLTHHRFRQSCQYFPEIEKRLGAAAAGESHALLTELSAILTDSELGPVSLMLLGFAIENACKGILIQRSPDLVEDTALRRELRSHNLPHLMTACGHPVAGPELKALSFLSEYVQWAGRYPTPIRPLDAHSIGQRYNFFLSSRIPVEELWTDTRPMYTTLIAATGFQAFPRDSTAAP